MRNAEDHQSEMIFTTKQLSELLELSSRRIQQLAEDGILVKESRGKYKAIDSIRNYINYVQKRDGGNDEEVDYWAEKALHERAKRQMAELELAEMTGEMHRSEDIKLVMNDMIASFRSRILAIPSKMAPQLVGEKEMPVILDKLTREVYEALTELSEYDPQKFYKKSEESMELSEHEESG